jgi:hypothetical protein
VRRRVGLHLFCRRWYCKVGPASSARAHTRRVGCPGTMLLSEPPAARGRLKLHAHQPGAGQPAVLSRGLARRQPCLPPCYTFRVAR